MTAGQLVASHMEAPEPSDAAEAVEPSDTIPLVGVEGKVPRLWTRISTTAVFVLAVVAVAVTVSNHIARARFKWSDKTAAVALSAMEEEYDVIVLGTGLTECVISGLLSVSGKKVLHMDRNAYYGAESASVSLSTLYNLFGKDLGDKNIYGDFRKWNIDLVPKFIMRHGEMVKFLIYTHVERYFDFTQIEGSYVYKRGGKVDKVPASTKEAMSSSLMGLLEKFRLKKFIDWATNLNFDNPETFGGVDPTNTTMDQVFHKFGLDESTAAFIGHAICLYPDDEYLEKPCDESIRRFKLYSDSLSSNGKSPYLYPLYGLGELPQSFARLSAVHGGTYRLNTPVDEIVMHAGKVAGVKAKGLVASAKMVIGDPSYFPDRVRKVGHVVRAICILNHPIADMGNLPSSQLILPGSQTGRKSDIYVVVLSSENRLAPEGYYLGFVSTIVETSDPTSELQLGLSLLEPIEQKFVSVHDMYHPKDDGNDSQIFISKSLDATTTSETVSDDIKNIHERVVGQAFDFDAVKDGSYS